MNAMFMKVPATRRGLSALLLLALVGMVLVFAIVRVYERLQPTLPLPVPPLAVETVRLEPAPFRLVRHYTGTVTAIKRVQLSAQVNARVLLVHHHEGETVAQGDVLITLDATELEDEVKRLEASGQRIRADLAFWQRQLERDLRLLKQKLIAPKQRDESRRMVRTLTASLQENRHTLAVARTRLGYATIRAPFAGRIQQLLAEAGELAAPGKPMLELVAPWSLKAVVTVPQKDMARLAVGVPVTLSLPVLGYSWQTVVNRIYPAVDAITRNATFEALVPESLAGPLPGMAIEAAVTVQREEGVLAIPHQALLRRKDGVGVFVVQADKARWRRVETGAAQEGLVWVRKGLEAGDEVIVTPDPRLVEGTRVMVPHGAAS
jgi:RND family efflux transporter MFP subunit